MIEVFGVYLTKDKRKAVIIDSKEIEGKRVYVGKIEGIRPYCHWLKDGSIYKNSMDETKAIDLEATS